MFQRWSNKNSPEKSPCFESLPLKVRLFLATLHGNRPVASCPASAGNLLPIEMWLLAIKPWISKKSSPQKTLPWVPGFFWRNRPFATSNDWPLKNKQPLKQKHQHPRHFSNRQNTSACHCGDGAMLTGSSTCQVNETLDDDQLLGTSLPTKQSKQFFQVFFLIAWCKIEIIFTRPSWSKII